MVERQIDLDAGRITADLELDAAGAADAAAGGDDARERRTVIDELHIVRTEEQLGVALGRFTGGEADGAPAYPELDRKSVV